MATRQFCDLCNVLLNGAPAKIIKAVAIVDNPAALNYGAPPTDTASSVLHIPVTVTVEGEYCDKCKFQILSRIKDLSTVAGIMNKKMGS